ncbi:MAG: CocE/NonD family hydrolase, partial [Candidatus Eisenbacteria bacterium]|nr:CocE/NonD family hydrolase [Candidatus Eisenbacteria bacterium]
MLRRLWLILLVSLPSSLFAGGYPTVEHRSIAMSDGILLNTDIYYPQDGQDPWPVILYRTPYGIAGDNVSWVTGAGYVAVCQDTRGRFGSQGVDRLFMDDGWGPDHQDGLETAQWILRQPWCNQKIGTLGGSARGITQNQLAGALPPNLRCQYVVVAP